MELSWLGLRYPICWYDLSAAAVKYLSCQSQFRTTLADALRIYVAFLRDPWQLGLDVQPRSVL